MEKSSYRSFWAILGLIFGPIFCQKCSKRLREPNKATFPHSLRYWAWILLKKIEIWLLGSFLAVLDLILGQFRSKNAKNVLDGLESQMRPFFHTVRGTEYEFCLKTWKITLTGPSWPFWASFLDQFFAKNVLEGLESQIRPLFHTIWGTECKSYLKRLKSGSWGHSWAFWSWFWANLGPKMLKMAKKAKWGHFSTQSEALSMNFALKYRKYLLEILPSHFKSPFGPIWAKNGLNWLLRPIWVL